MQISKNNSGQKKSQNKAMKNIPRQTREGKDKGKYE